jgi:RNA polymerase sigma-70 factor, ECF subfamily
MSEAPTGSPDWGRYRQYFILLARTLVSSKLQSKVDCSDLVQETLLRAARSMHTFNGTTDAELRGWLRVTLVNVIRDQYAKATAKKRDVALEYSLNAALEESSARLEDWLRDSAEGPEALVIKEDLLDTLAGVINQLPPNQRTAVELFYIHGLTAGEIASQMGATKKAVGGLIARGIKTIRAKLREC